jgi:hypothetical protein
VGHSWTGRCGQENRTPAVQPAARRYVNATNEKYHPEMPFSSAVNISVVNSVNEIKRFLPFFTESGQIMALRYKELQTGHLVLLGWTCSCDGRDKDSRQFLWESIHLEMQEICTWFRGLGADVVGSATRELAS